MAEFFRQIVAAPIHQALPSVPMTFEAFRIAILGIFSAFQPVWYPAGQAPETPEERATRWTMIAEVVAEEARGTNQTPFSPQDAAALVVAIIRGESALEYNVHAGRESHIGTADAGRARCMGQIHHVKAWWSEEEWKALAGLDEEATGRCIRAILRILDYHADRCQMRRKLPQKIRWRDPLDYFEMKQLIRYYGNGHCGFRTTKTMRQKATLALQIRRELPVFQAEEREKSEQAKAVWTGPFKPAKLACEWSVGSSLIASVGKSF